MYPTDTELESLFNKHYQSGATEPIGSKERAQYEQRKESFIAGFKAGFDAQNREKYIKNLVIAYMRWWVLFLPKHD